MKLALLTDLVLVSIGVALGMHFQANRPQPEVEVVLSPIHVPAPWGACRASIGPYEWVGEFGEDGMVEDSVWFTVVCPRGVQP